MEIKSICLTGLFVALLVAQLSARSQDNYPGYSKCDTSPSAGTICHLDPLDFSPTQLMIGYDDAYTKQLLIESLKKDELEKYLKKNMIPVVMGPGNKYYMTDHHHHVRAMYDANIADDLKKLIANVTDNWSKMEESDFWPQMLVSGYYWPFDPKEHGPLDPAYLQVNIENIPDDPYRSLATLVEDAGIFSKTGVPFAEFMWANFFRENIPMLFESPECNPVKVTPDKLVDMPWCCIRPADPKCFPDPYHNGTSRFEAAALALAKTPAAKGLPGYRPPKSP